ncbi:MULTISPECIES: cupin domain-containing protein [Culturomica]|jgi:cupin 2 domain-containing protein|uniref:cupin domain-containing protein n=1 Tax=Culturomica TaxID=1926651 RepID=UPI000337B80E|nr:MULTISPECIES: cupin domain-containing protein [Odoribacteraceae]CCZ06034.1 putative uncharacterized protein [Odoribacter sp. CAG:788]
MDLEIKNIFQGIALVGEEEQFDLLIKGKHYRIDRIVSSGHSSPQGFWYDQEDDEWIMLIQGKAVLEIEDKLVELKAGDYLFLPKNCRHRVEKTSVDPACVWLCFFAIE